MIAFPLIVSLLALAFAVWLGFGILRAGRLPPELRTLHSAAVTNISAFISRQYTITLAASFVISGFIFLSYVSLLEEGYAIGFQLSAFFLLGIFCCSAVSFAGLYVSGHAALKVATAVKTGILEAFRTALKSGVFSGIAFISVGIFWICVLISFMYGPDKPVSDIILKTAGFGFGILFMAFLNRILCGIYLRSADAAVFAAGKSASAVPAVGIASGTWGGSAAVPLDDARNPAAMAKLAVEVSFGSFTSGMEFLGFFSAAVIAAMMFGAGLYPVYGAKAVFFPLVMLAFGLISSGAGLAIAAKYSGETEHIGALDKGYFAANMTGIAGFLIATVLFFENNMWLFLAGTIGIACGYFFISAGRHYTGIESSSTRMLAESSAEGPAKFIFNGFTFAVESVWPGAAVISICAVVGYYCGVRGLERETPAWFAGLYGMAASAIGMFLNMAYVVSIDGFAWTIRTAGAVLRITRHEEDAVRKMAVLESCAAETRMSLNRRAVVLSIFLVFLLISAYIQHSVAGGAMTFLNLTGAGVLVAGLAGVSIILVFSGLCFKATGKAMSNAAGLVENYFREDQKILKTSPFNHGGFINILAGNAFMSAIGCIIFAFPALFAAAFIFKKLGGCIESMFVMLFASTITGMITVLTLGNAGILFGGAGKTIKMRKNLLTNFEAHKSAVAGEYIAGNLNEMTVPALYLFMQILWFAGVLAVPLLL
ncbi:MAG: sodium/proton-translocating pyrophosphatase [Elusimicrobia bacterium]|nr:sodium/proton-translocating pyrophosphatase [Elusimicrobiota bacterium]